MQIVERILLLVILTAGLTTPLAAQRPSQAQTNAVRQSCRADYEANCSSVPPGGQASLQCLQQHLAQLSPPCRSAVAALPGGAGEAANPAKPAEQPAQLSPRQKSSLMRRSCSADYRSYCAGVQPGGGRALQCLAENRERLSPTCRSALESVGG